MKKRIISFVLIAVMAIGFLPTLASALTAGSFNNGAIDWFFDEDTGVLTVGGEGAVELSDGEFPWEAYKENITSIVIGEGITEITDNAFSHYSSVKTVKLPDSLKRIGSYAFFDCYALTSIIIPENTEVIDACAFYSCTELNSITLPDGLTKIGEDILYGTPIYDIDDLWENGVLYFGNYLLAADEVSGSYTVKDGTTVIADAAFYACDSLEHVTIPASVNHIGYFAFGQCASLTSVTMAEGVKTIGNQAFFNSVKLSQVTLADSIEYIGESVFTDTEIYKNDENRENGVLYIGKHLIDADYETKFGAYAVKEGTRTIAGGAFYDCWYLNAITIPDSVVSIGSWAFTYSNQFNRLKLPDSVKYIGEYAFLGCQFDALTLSGGMTDIEDGSFYGCVINTVYMPAGIKSVSDSAFRDASIDYVCYGGSEEDRQAIELGKFNDALDGAEWMYEQTGFPVPESVEIASDESEITTFVGVPVFRSVEITPYMCRGAELKWTSSNTEVATVDSLGIITGLKEGTATITVTAADDENVSDSIDVTVKAVSEIKLGDSKTVTDGNRFYFIPENSGYYMFYSSYDGDPVDSYAHLYFDNEEINYDDDSAKKSNFKIVEYLEKDKTYYLETGVFPDYASLEYTVNVEEAVKATAIEIADKEYNTQFMIGDRWTPSAVFYPINSIPESYTFSFDNEEAASFEEGTFTFNAVGTVTITVTSENGLEDSTEVTVTDQPLAENMYINSDGISGIVGMTEQLSVYFEPSDAKAESVRWTSGNDKVATVNEEGFVTLIGEGSTTITAVSERGLEAEVSVTVVLAPPEISEGQTKTVDSAAYFTFKPKESGYYNFYSEIIDEYCDTVGYIYNSNMQEMSSDDDSAEGNCFIVKQYLNEGETYYLYARMYDTELSASYNVTVEKSVWATDVELYYYDNAYVGETSQLYVIFYPMNAAPEAYALESSDERIISIDDDGWLEFNAVGTATVTVTSENGLEDSIEITVKEREPATAIELDYQEIYGYVGEYYYLNIGFIPDDAIYEDYTVTSSNEDVVYYNEFGELALLSVGEATITVTSENGLTDSCKVVVREMSEAKVGDRIEYTRQDGVLKFIFVPEEDGWYSFSSESEVPVDSWVDIFNVNYDYIEGDDDSGVGNHFMASYYMTAGETYYIHTGLYDQSSEGDGFTVVVQEAVPATSFEIEDDEVNFCVNQFLTPNCVFYPQNAIVEDITLTVSDDTFAEVDSDYIFFNGKGTVTVTATTENGFSDTMVVTVSDHVYENDCDPTCENCFWEREVYHEWGEYIYNNDATTEQDGTKTAECLRGCGAEDTIVAEGTKLTPDSRLPMVYLNDEGNGVVTDMRGSWATRVYWGRIGDEDVEYKDFDRDFRLLCGTDYFADYAPRADKSYYFTEAGYYRFVLKCIISGTDASNYKYKDVVYTFYFDGSNVSVPSVELIDGNHVCVKGNGIKIKKFYYGNIGQTNTPYSWFNDFWNKSLITKSYKAVYGPRDNTEVTLSTKGYYNFVICFDDASGRYQELAYTVYADNDVAIITDGGGNATVNLDNIGGTVNKLYWGYIGQDAEGVTDYDTLKAAAGTLDGDWDVKNGESYIFTQAGYYGFSVNYSTKCLINGNENTVVTYDILYIIEN